MRNDPPPAPSLSPSPPRPSGRRNRTRALGKRFGIALLILAGAFILWSLFLHRVEKNMADFEVNNQAGRRIRLGETLYRSPDGHYQFKYPPFSAILYVPLSRLPLRAAKAAWFILVLGSTAGILFFSKRLVLPERSQNPWLPALTFLILAKFFLREAQLGQINALITFLLLLMIFVQADTRHSSRGARAAGLLWGAASALKLYSLIFLPYWAIQKKWRVLVWGAAFLAAAFIAPAAFYGFAGNLQVHREWISSLSSSTPTLLTSQDNISLLAMLMKWTGQPRLSAILFGLALVALGTLLASAINKGKDLPRPVALETSFLLLFIPLISPLGWDYTLLSAAPAVMVILAKFRSFPAAGRIILAADLAIIGLSLYDLMGRRLYARFMSLSIITVNVLILAGALFYLRLRRME